MTRLTKEEYQQLKKEYLQLDEQGRADWMYKNRISGGLMMLSPDQYPKVPPHHTPCKCGGKPELIIAPIGDDYVRCTVCGRRAQKAFMPWEAWANWEDGKYEDEATLFDFEWGEE